VGPQQPIRATPYFSRSRGTAYMCRSTSPSCLQMPMNHPSWRGYTLIIHRQDRLSRTVLTA
jgi:hypothetical protein